MSETRTNWISDSDVDFPHEQNFTNQKSRFGACVKEINFAHAQSLPTHEALYVHIVNKYIETQYNMPPPGFELSTFESK